MKTLIDAWAKFLLGTKPWLYLDKDFSLRPIVSHPCQGCSQQLYRTSAKMSSNKIKYHIARCPCSLQGLRLDHFPTQTILFYDSMLIKAFLNMQTNVEKWDFFTYIGEGVGCHWRSTRHCSWRSKAEEVNTQAGAVLCRSQGSWGTKHHTWCSQGKQLYPLGYTFNGLGCSRASSCCDSCTIAAPLCTLVSPMNRRNLWTLKYCLMLKIWDCTSLVLLIQEQISCFYCRSF